MSRPKEAGHQWQTPGSQRGKSNRVDAITLDVNAEVDDNKKLLVAITQNVATMLEQISRQMGEFEDTRNAADSEMKMNFQRLGQEVLEIKMDLRGEIRAWSNVIDFSRVKGWLDEHTKGLHKKLDGHGRKQDELAKLMECRPDHDALMKGVHGIITSEISKLPLPPSEEVLLQAVQGMQESSLGQTLGAIEKLNEQTPDHTAVKGWIDIQARELHDKLDSHGIKYDSLTKSIDRMPDHETLMNGVHGLLVEHMNDHSCRIMASINKLPLPPDEKVLLQAFRSMQEVSLAQTLEAIEKLRKQTPDVSGVQGCVKGCLDIQAKGLHDKLDGHSKNHDNLMELLDRMPDHDALMKGVHGLLVEHMNDHSCKIMSSINMLPVPPDEKSLLQAIENMQEGSLGQTLEALEKLKKQIDNLAKSMGGMPDHDTLMGGLNGLLADHMNDHSGKIMSSMNETMKSIEMDVVVQGSGALNLSGMSVAPITVGSRSSSPRIRSSSPRKSPCARSLGNNESPSGTKLEHPKKNLLDYSALSASSRASSFGKEDGTSGMRVAQMGFQVERPKGKLDYSAKAKLWSHSPHGKRV